MFCVSCGSKFPEGARFCPSCGLSATSSPAQSTETLGPIALPPESSGQNTPAIVSPTPNVKLREKLLQCYLNLSTSQDLSGWLQDLGQDQKGTVDEKIARIREHTKYLSMSPETFAPKTISYLSPYDTENLAEICEDLGLDSEGGKNSLFRRIYREVGYKEGWLPPISKETAISKQTVLPFVKWYPILKSYEYEKDYYPDFCDEMSEVFGDDNVHEEHAVAHGTTLKIDFHIGHPQSGGVGIEFKLPTSNSELQRALGQMDQYVSRYGPNLIIVLIPLPDFLKKAQETLFLDELKRKGIEAVVKTKTL